MASTPIELQIPAGRTARTKAAARVAEETVEGSPRIEEPSPLLHARAADALVLAARPVRRGRDLV